jgi:hypothetical protein
VSGCKGYSICSFCEVMHKRGSWVKIEHVSSEKSGLSTEGATQAWFSTISHSSSKRSRDIAACETVVTALSTSATGSSSSAAGLSEVVADAGAWVALGGTASLAASTRRIVATRSDLCK